MSSDAPCLPARPQRVLACVLCQQRKVKCDRKFPCANCVKSQAQCVPATLAPRRRRRRFPDRELLDRLRSYEELLRQNNISFDSVHSETITEKDHVGAEGEHELETQERGTSRADSVPSTTLESERSHGTKSFWHTMSQGFRDPGNDSDSSNDFVRETEVKRAWDETIQKDDNLLFGSRDSTVDLSIIHPDTIQIFRLWQIYLDNVNPLLKVTHTPTLQGRIIEAASNLKNVHPTLEALMFGIYSIAVTSLTADECQAIISSSKEDLLTRFHFGCQQALLGCGFLRTGDRDCLTALYLYLISLSFGAVPQSISSMLGIAIRIARRMGIHTESTLAKCSILEAEMRRRLWWSLVVFDHRINEVSSSLYSILDPTWDCKVPLNVNDSDLRPEMKEPPVVQGTSTEALFAIVRSELWDRMRHTAFHLDFTNPSLKPLAKHPSNESASELTEMARLERFIENRYLKFCDQDNPIHFMTLWSTRAQIAKLRLLEHLSSHFDSTRTDAQHEAATSHALTLIECDTKVMTSSLTNPFHWFNQFYFPFPGYIQIAQDIRSRPYAKQTQRAWKSLSDNHEAWFKTQRKEHKPIHHIFAKVVLQAWEAYEAAIQQPDKIPTPKIVLSVRAALAENSRQARKGDVESLDTNLSTGLEGFAIPTPMPVGYDNRCVSLSTGLQADLSTMRSEMVYDVEGQAPIFDMSQLDWTAFGGGPNWPGF
ncbi:C6 transcription factor, putative [Talaromyces stipitatus ATCC 10500]|uniref:C6 transcription factor, putative n=1 Tax=Talaromyces stipitatus (strain ATCC 10500 / CBS 375.48 / QM 6759 / NRRL 1006) TaxID=441959 RepID=B8M9D1_TALSN|nr:C6 transcription factor, putative [Talaromyces stipitatus ATCC 10500]EED17691.1 C6 transcription factor, putative [Talaromyces stipitatus ATCC 10500]